MGLIFILVLAWTLYTLYNYYKASNFLAILILLGLYGIFSMFSKNKTMVMFWAVIFTNIYYYYGIVKNILKIK